MAQIFDSIKRKGKSDHATLRIKMSKALLFTLKRITKSHGRFTTNFIITLFLKYDPKIHGRHINQTEKYFVKYFINFWPYPRKNKLNSAIKPGYFYVVTNRTFVENVRRLALMEGMKTNDFVVKVLSDYCLAELQNDIMLYRKRIPDY